MSERKERYVLRGGKAGHERLKILARAQWPDTAILFESAAIRPGMRCMDLGCGGGEVTFELAKLVGPSGHVTGIDMDEVKLDLGRASGAQRGVANTAFRAANVNEWNEPSSYDIVYCRFLLQHLSKPIDLLQRMWAAVKPGGAIVVEDADFGGLFCEPANEGFDFYARMYPRVLARYGGDATAARRLYRQFLQAGIPRPNLRLVQSADVDGEAKQLSMSTLEAVAGPIVAENLASQDEVSAALVSLATFTDDPTTLIGRPRIFQLWSRRALD